MPDSENYRYASGNTYGADYGDTRRTDATADLSAADHDVDGGVADADTTTPRKRRSKSAPAAEFSEPLVPLQIKLPADLVASLKLLSFSERQTMSEIVLRCLTSGETVPKVWLSRRGA